MGAEERRPRPEQPAVGTWLLIDAVAFNLVFPGGEIVAAALAVFCVIRAVLLRRRSGTWR